MPPRPVPSTTVSARGATGKTPVSPRPSSRDPAGFDLAALAERSEGFSGAEIEEAIISALFDAFSQERDLDTDMILASLQQTVPLSKTMSEELGRLRNWAAGRARLASGPVSKPFQESRRKIELE